MTPGEGDMARQGWQRAILIVAVGTTLSAAMQTAEAGHSRTKVRGRNSTPITNTAPTISGTPQTAVGATKAYRFTPYASDAQNNALTFSIANKPVWATFSAASGTLGGTPSSTQAGTYGNIVIKVSDGSLSASLPYRLIG